jgi:hypothetical protein
MIDWWSDKLGVGDTSQLWGFLDIAVLHRVRSIALELWLLVHVWVPSFRTCRLLSKMKLLTATPLAFVSWHPQEVSWALESIPIMMGPLNPAIMVCRVCRSSIMLLSACKYPDMHKKWVFAPLTSAAVNQGDRGPLWVRCRVLLVEMIAVYILLLCGGASKIWLVLVEGQLVILPPLEGNSCSRRISLPILPAF